jgi:hypothetical protein
VFYSTVFCLVNHLPFNCARYPLGDNDGAVIMLVFISWSGEPSRSIARSLADWLIASGSVSA